ncbi:alpha/beta fold hydrolase [Micromonospora sp. ZYX-F-536]|uniref:alpha/beta fold hydrolase n=1 Tax=Micromonospora sp. ZYX-F-536 TaxID=3457629 RepID=UPI004040764E
MPSIVSAPTARRGEGAAIPAITQRMLAHGDELAADHAREMIARRAGQARLTELPAGHVVHHDAPTQFAAAVSALLSELD